MRLDMAHILCKQTLALHAHQTAEWQSARQCMQGTDITAVRVLSHVMAVQSSQQGGQCTAEMITW